MEELEKSQLPQDDLEGKLVHSKQTIILRGTIKTRRDLL